MKQPIRITLIEDHPEYREVIALALSKETDLKLTGTYGSAERALRKLQNPKPEEIPDIILLDLNLPGMSGLEAVPWLIKYVPKSKIVVLSQSDKEAEVLAAVQLGASGYLLKSAQIHEVVEAIRSASQGYATLDPHIASYIMAAVQTRKPELKLGKPLSDREMEILVMLSKGMLKKEIANTLGISINTVVKHIVHIYEKLEVQNAAAAINKAYRSGLLKPFE